MSEFRSVACDGAIDHPSSMPPDSFNAVDGTAERRSSRGSTSGGPGSSQQTPAELAALAAAGKSLIEQFRQKRAAMNPDSVQRALEAKTGESLDCSISTDALERAASLARRGNIEIDAAAARQMEAHRRAWGQNAHYRSQHEKDELNDAAQAARRELARSHIAALEPPVRSKEEAVELSEALLELHREQIIDLLTYNAYAVELARRESKRKLLATFESFAALSRPPEFDATMNAGTAAAAARGHSRHQADDIAPLQGLARRLQRVRVSVSNAGITAAGSDAHGWSTGHDRDAGVSESNVSTTATAVSSDTRRQSAAHDRVAAPMRMKRPAQPKISASIERFGQSAALRLGRALAETRNAFRGFSSGLNDFFNGAS